MIELHQIRKRFGATTALAELSLRCDDGAVTGLLGPNGAGKTTALRILAGLLRPDSGRALIDGADVARDPTAARRRLGLLGEVLGLYDRLTGREHLHYAGELCGLSPGAARDAAERLIAEFELGFVDRRAAGYSLGERRKLALVRALVHAPRNVVLDEPTIGLDVPSARFVRRAVRALAGRGACVLFSSHVMHEVAELCDRVVVLSAGRVVADAPPAELVGGTGAASFEDAFVQLIGGAEGLS